MERRAVEVLTHRSHVVWLHDDGQEMATTFAVVLVTFHVATKTAAGTAPVMFVVLWSVDKV